MNKQDHVALVTGGSSGIGLAIVRALLARGWKVALCGRDGNKLERATTDLAGSEPERAERLLASTADVSNAEDVRRWVSEACGHFGPPSILVNNAGIYIDRGIPGSELDLSIVRQTMETNFYGPLRLSQMCIPLMQRHKYGRIVNISSQMGALSNMGSDALAYRVSKTALNAMTLILANELRGSNIAVNTVDPGWVKTDMGGSGAPRSVKQGADTAVWLATQPDGVPSGGYFRDRKIREW